MRNDVTGMLEIGKCYFHLGYHDRNLTVPFVTPYFFLGKDLFPGMECWFFQGAPEFMEGQKPPEFAEDIDQVGIVAVPADGLTDFVDWSGLVAELSENKKLQDQGRFYSQKE